MSVPGDSEAPATARIDRWLFAVRLFGSRSLAADAVGGGRVHVNAARVKPSHAVRVGDQVSFVRGTVEFACEVLSLPARRGPAREAVLAYRELEESVQRRAEFSARMKVDFRDVKRF
jgi:ribosome-associated heat shock protein Hsp15